MRRALSIAFWLFFVLTSVLGCFIAFSIWIATYPFDRDRRTNHAFSCAWGSLYALAYPGWRVRVLHRERIARDKAYVIVANHTSVADIVLCYTLFRQFKWVSKESVFRIPLVGWNMRLSGYVPLVRGDEKSIQQMMETCLDWLRRGISIMMFPEGTRSDDGTVKHFKHGAFTLALDANVSVVPIAIHGGHELIPKHGKTFATRAELVVEVLDPVPPAGFSDATEYAESIRGIIQRALQDRPSPALSRSVGVNAPEREIESRPSG